jgi:hypothetical protein
MHRWQLWTYGQTLKQVDGVRPLLASWEKNTHPAQIRLRSYLEDLMLHLKPLPATPAGLFLHLDVDVGEPQNLLHHHDLENYLTPLFGPRWLDPSRFLLVSATKRVGQGSRLLLGEATPLSDVFGTQNWQHFSYSAGSGADSKPWKENLRAALARSCPQPLPPGAVAVHLAWRCSSLRNWVNLWKPTGDTMGPVLGENSSRRFHPNDDRIVSLGLHLNLDRAAGYSVEVGMWWQSWVADIEGRET